MAFSNECLFLSIEILEYGKHSSYSNMKKKVLSKRLRPLVTVD